MIVYYTKSSTDDSQAKNTLVHSYEHGEKTICGIDIDSRRWYIDIGNEKEVTCKKCLALVNYHYPKVVVASCGLL